MNSSSKQTGMALIMAMVLLTVLSIIGLSAGRTSNIQERISANFFDRSVAFQTAQETLKYVESLVDGNAFQQAPTANDCANGVLIDLKDGQNERFRDISFQCWADVAGNIAPSGAQPQYYIEYMGADDYSNNAPCSSNQSAPETCHFYRITTCSMPARNTNDPKACSNPSDAQAVVYLRSVYIRKDG